MGMGDKEEEEKDLTSFAGFEAGVGAIAKHRGWPLEFGKVKETDSPPGPLTP